MKILLSLLMLSLPALSSELTLGLNISSFDYKEEITPPDKSSENGIIPALYGSLKIPVVGMGARSYVEFEGDLAINANTKYDGSVLSTHAPITATDKNTFLRMEGNFYFSGREGVWLHAGYGFQYWRRSLVYGTGYNEIYTWSTIPLGVLIEVPVSSDTTMGIDLTYKIMIGGKINVIFSETVAGGNDTTLDLGNMPGFKISFPVKIGFSSGSSLLIKPWYEYSEIAASNTAYNSTPTGSNSALGNIQEPASRTRQYGIIGAMTFEF